MLNGYIRAGRIENVIEFFNFMIYEHVIPWVPCMNILLTELVRRNTIDEMRHLYNKMVLRGIYGDRYIEHVMYQAFLKEGRVEDVEEYLWETKERGDELDAGAYGIVIRVVYR